MARDDYGEQGGSRHATRLGAEGPSRSERLRSVRDTDKEDLQRLLGLAEGGRLSRSDVAALFMYVRGDAPNGSMLKDIGHTVAHDERDRGFAYDHVNAFVAQIVDVFTNGGPFEVGVLFEVGDLLTELSQFCEGIGLTVDLGAMLDNHMPTAGRIANLLDGTSIKVTGPVKATCKFSRSDVGPVVTIDFHEEFGKVIRMRPGVGIAVPLLVDHRA